MEKIRVKTGAVIGIHGKDSALHCGFCFGGCTDGKVAALGMPADTDHSRMK